MSRVRLSVAARTGLIIVLAAGAAAGGYAVTDAVRGDAEQAGARVRTPPVLSRLNASPVPRSAPAPAAAPSAAAVRRALSPLVIATGLGSDLRARVLDVTSGRLLYDRRGTAAAAPASTAKLLTAAAVLSDYRVTDRITTRIVAGSGRAIVLVGGGDPTLTGARGQTSATYAGAARISDLAAQLKRAHIRPRSIVVDGSLFRGPAVSPAWAAADVPTDFASPITAVLADGGRSAPDDFVRSGDPDLAAGRLLAAALGRPELPVTRGRAGTGGRELARVRSAPIGTLVEQMLLESDNVIAECLARQVALAEHRPASFTGAAAAIRSVLSRLGADPGAGLVDASGLAARDRLSPATLASVLRLAAAPARPRLHAVIGSLPVAAWSGTLADRYVAGAARAGRGVVRAKTGTLTGVSTLAGVVHTSHGRQLAFALMAERTGATADAQQALDAIAARLARL